VNSRSIFTPTLKRLLPQDGTTVLMMATRYGRSTIVRMLVTNVRASLDIWDNVSQISTNWNFCPSDVSQCPNDNNWNICFVSFIVISSSYR